MHVITAERPPSQQNYLRYICKSVLLSGLRESRMTRERCGSICISNWVFEVVCFGEPDCTGLNSTPRILESAEITLPGSWEKEGKLHSEGALRPNSLLLISVQLQLINLSREFGALHLFQPHKTIVIFQLSLQLLLLKFYLYSGADLQGCFPLLEGLSKFWEFLGPLLHRHFNLNKWAADSWGLSLPLPLPPGHLALQFATITISVATQPRESEEGLSWKCNQQKWWWLGFQCLATHH